MGALIGAICGAIGGLIGYAIARVLAGPKPDPDDPYAEEYNIPRWPIALCVALALVLVRPVVIGTLPDNIGGAPMSREQALDDLSETNPAIAAIKNNEPELYRAVIAEVPANPDQANIDAFMNRVISLMGTELPRWVRYGSDTDVAKYAQITHQQLEELSNRPELCRGYLAGTLGNPTGVLSADVLRRDLEAVAALINNQGEEPGTMAREDELIEIVSDSMTEVAEAENVEPTEIQAAAQGTGSAALQCEYVKSIFNKMVSQPTAETASLYRAFLRL